MLRISSLACIVIIATGLVMLAVASTEAGASKKDTLQQQEEGSEKIEQEPGQPLYFNPEKSEGSRVDDSAPYSDPYYGKDREAAGGGGQRGPAGVTEDESEVKHIEGPVRYERVE